MAEDKLALVNASHLAKHCGVEKGYDIVSMVKRRISYSSDYCYAKVTRANGVVYYSKLRSAHFDVEAAIVAIEESAKKPFGRVKDYDYQSCIDILVKVLDDRIEFGEQIPDTSDVWEALYVTPPYLIKKEEDAKKSEERSEERKEELSSKKTKCKSFIKEFAEADIIWS